MSATKEVSPIVDFSAGVVAGKPISRAARAMSYLLKAELSVADLYAGVAGLVVGQPFDVVKVRYQTPEYAGRYNSISGAFRES